MKGTEIDKRVFDVYKDYGIYHPDFIVINREISKKIIGPISNTVEYNIGKQIGELIAEECLKISKDDLLNTCFEIVEKSGWGKIEFDEKKNLIKVQNTVVSKYYAKHKGILKEPIDDILQGIFAAIIKIVTKKECEIKEEKCIVMGDDHCEFVIQGV